MQQFLMSVEGWSIRHFLYVSVNDNVLLATLRLIGIMLYTLRVKLQYYTMLNMYWHEYQGCEIFKGPVCRTPWKKGLVLLYGV